MKGILPDWVENGQAVWYESRPGKLYAAVVVGLPWQLGDGTWVTRLGNLGDDYATETGTNRHFVSCAAVHCLTRREDGCGAYPPGWPRCPACGDYALDGHITCGRVECDEGGRR